MLRLKQYIHKASTDSCPVCSCHVESVQYEYEQAERLCRIYHCEQCSFFFARPVIIPDLGNRQMDTVDDAEFFHQPLLKIMHQKIIIGKEISAVLKLLKGRGGSLLDIGCGTGWITALWKGAGFSVSGLEPSPARAKLAAQRGVEILGGYLEEYTAERKFDVIIMRHVLEHLESPLDALMKLRGMLRDGGVLVLIVPNIDCIGRLMFRDTWSWILPWHCNFFNPKSARAVVERSGLSVNRCYQTPSPLWYPESVVRTFPRSRFVRWLFGRIHAVSLLLCAPIVFIGYVTGHNDNLTIIAQK